LAEREVTEVGDANFFLDFFLWVLTVEVFAYLPEFFFVP